MSQRRIVFSVALVSIWLVVVVSTLWWFQFRHISVFEVEGVGEMPINWAHFSGPDIKRWALPPITSLARVVHFVDPNCPCSRFAYPHISELEREFGEKVEFVNGLELMQQPVWRGLTHLPLRAVPAVAIWDKAGGLRYFGPYSGGSVCGQGEDFVRQVLTRIEQQQPISWTQHDVIGCFCHSSNNSASATPPIQI